MFVLRAEIVTIFEPNIIYSISKIFDTFIKWQTNLKSMFSTLSVNLW
jgi:hypothetical protein